MDQPAEKKPCASIDFPFYQHDVPNVSYEVWMSKYMKEEMERNAGGTNKRKTTFIKRLSMKTHHLESDQTESTTSGVTDHVTKEKKRRKRQEAIVREYEADDQTSLLKCEEGMCNEKVQVNGAHRKIVKSIIHFVGKAIQTMSRGHGGW